MARMRLPELEVVRFASEDVIATSGFFMSVSEWNSLGNNVDDSYPYVFFSGTMYPLGEGTYGVGTDGYGFEYSQAEYDTYLESVRNDYGWQNYENPYTTYDSYVDEYNNIRTHGASYHELYHNQ